MERKRKSYEPFLVSGLVVRLLSPYLGSAKELSSKRGASINRVGGKASFTEAKLAHKTPSAPLSPAAKAHTKSLLTGHYSPDSCGSPQSSSPKAAPLVQSCQETVLGMSCSKTNRGEFSEHMYVVREREKCRLHPVQSSGQVQLSGQ